MFESTVELSIKVYSREAKEALTNELRVFAHNLSNPNSKLQISSDDMHLSAADEEDFGTSRGSVQFF
jgi:hypothetical protein